MELSLHALRLLVDTYEEVCVLGTMVEANSSRGSEGESNQLSIAM